MANHAHDLSCIEEGPRGLYCKVTGEGKDPEKDIRDRIRRVAESIGYFASSPLDLAAVSVVKQQLASGMPTNQIMEEPPYTRVLRLWKERRASLKSSEPVFAQSVRRAQRLERESARTGKTFGSPYRLSVYVAGRGFWQPVEPTGDTGHFGIYSTPAEAEHAANLYKQKHGTPSMMSLRKQVSAKRDMPIWDETGGERRVAAEVLGRVKPPARPKKLVFPAGTESLVIEREPLDQGGYTRSGRYFGTGEKLWSVTDENGERYWHVRAPSKADARRVALDPKWGRG